MPVNAYPQFLHSVRASIDLPDGAAIRVAASGGPDSTALVALFARFCERHRPDLRLSLGHVHHGLRGSDADADAEYCAELADRFALPLRVDRVDTRARMRERGESLETAARELRLEVFARWAIDDELSAVATGHHADDQLETVLAHVLRGCGMIGLRGMPWCRPLPGTDASLLRPLLDHDRVCLSEFLQSIGLEARHDRTNDDIEHTRNRIRHELIPLLKQFNPAVRDAIAGLSEEASRILENQPAAQLSVLRGPSIASVNLRNATSEPLASGVLDRLWGEFHASKTGLTRGHHDQLGRFLSGSDGNRYSLPGGWTLERVGSWIHLHRLTDLPPATSVRGPLESETHLDWVNARVIPSLADGPINAQGLWLGPSVRDRCGEWRTARGDDRIRIASGHAQVFELLRTAGVPTQLRERYPVLEVDGEVWWIPAVRVSVSVPKPASDRAKTSVGTIEHGPGRSVILRLTTTADASPEAFILNRVAATSTYEAADTE